MEEDNQASASIFSRYRSPTFSKDEIQTLINLIERHKYTVLNKSTNNNVNQAKEVSWEKITKAFNSQGFSHERSIDSLKTKWENLKKRARKLTKNIDGNDNGYRDITKQIVNMMVDIENNTPAEATQDMAELDDFGETVPNVEKNSHSLKRKSFWEACEDKQSDDNSKDGDDEKRANRSYNFTPQESTLLLECVRKEKKHIFSMEYSAHAIGMKNRAWRRITDTFNRKSPQKRSQKVLRTKFNNMKKVAKTMDIKEVVKNFGLNSPKHEKLDDEDSTKIKSEPMFELEIENPVDDDHQNSDSNHFAPDPLSTILNSDSGIGSSHSSLGGQENKEVVKLKIDLLNFQMETARLERQRIETASRADAATREAKAVEASLRLRAARLEATAAALKLPREHPALAYTAEEIPAEKYLAQYEHT